MKKLALLIALCFIFSLSACTSKETNISVEQPENLSTGDEIFPALNVNSIEQSPNANGMRFTFNLEDFTKKYNEITKETGGNELLDFSKWIKQDNVQTDVNGVKIQYYYYDENNINFTASVEVESQKLVNVGCGTTMGNFIKSENNVSNSDIILRKTAIMAQAVCQFPLGSTDVLQDIFYRTTNENVDSLWYQGFVFALSTQNDKTNSENSVMLFRVFPITDELKTEWEILDYEIYSASVPNETVAVVNQGVSP